MVKNVTGSDPILRSYNLIKKEIVIKKITNRKIYEIFEKYLEIEKIVLFGFRARGENSPKSDYSK